jgi:hypothetical protein
MLASTTSRNVGLSFGFIGRGFEQFLKVSDQIRGALPRSGIWILLIDLDTP